MPLDLAHIIAAYDAAFTAMHSTAHSILMLLLVPFNKLLGMQRVLNTAMLLQLQATSLHGALGTESLARDGRNERMCPAMKSAMTWMTLNQGCIISVLPHQCIYCATQQIVTCMLTSA